MIYKELFKSPLRTVELINLQANAPENVAFAKKYFPPFKDGTAIWDAVKPLTKFKADPKTVDTIQGISTLFSNTANIHGVSGWGDCDCFVSALASIAIANNIPFEYIVQGNDKPSHIAIKIGGVILDLTNPIPDYLRDYQFTKYINPMYVALADDNEELAMETDFGRPNLRRLAKTAAKYHPAIRGVQKLTAAQKAKILLAKRKLKRCGYGDSEAALLSINSSLGAGGRGMAKLKGAVSKYSKYVVPVAGVGLNLIAPGVGGKALSVAKAGFNKLQGAKSMLQNIAPSPATLPNMPSAGIMPNKTTMATTPTTPPEFTPGTYVTDVVPVTAPKINPMLLLGGAALAIFLFTKKK
jgi:hypothetical protein